MVKKYVPDRGDIVWLNFTPQSGNEQGGVRPAIVISPKAYNQKTGFVVCCPITSKVKGYPFEVLLVGTKIKGVILSDHLKNLDWKVREIKFIEKLPASALTECIHKITLLIS